MAPDIDWPPVDRLLDHWSSWRPEWTDVRPRLLWYLTFEERPEVGDTAAQSEADLGACGLDVVPARWLHLTLADIGFADSVDPDAFHAMAEEVHEELAGTPDVHLSLGPLALMTDAVVLVAQPYDAVQRLREVVRTAGERHGVPLADADEGFWPHVTLGYVNGATDHGRLHSLVEASQPTPVDVTCDRLRQVLVIRTGGHYRWHGMGDVRLGG